MAGTIVAGPHVRAQCARHLADLKRPKKDGLVWDLEAVHRALSFFPQVLRLSEGQFEGQAFRLHPAQAFIVGSIFGWRLRSTGLRRFRRAYIEQGKGNGKSPLAAGIGLYGLVADGESGAQVYAAAAKMDQARILFNDAVSMVRQSPDLEAVVSPTGVNPVNQLTYYSRSGAPSFFKPLGRDTGKTGSGLRPHFVMADELHEHPDRSTLEMLERGFKFRRQPLVVMITNSGSDRTSVCWEEHEHAVRVAHGDVVDDATFTYVCALDEGEDPLEDPASWVKANPLLEMTITKDYLAGVVAQAKAIPARANSIRRLHFCEWTDAESAWISRAIWEAAEDPELELADFAGKRCWIGLDLGATRDLVGKSYLFEDGVDKEGRPRFVLFGHGYSPADTLLEREKADRAPYLLWAEEGHITALDGRVIRLDHIAADIVNESQKFDLAAVAYDKWLIRDFELEVSALGASLPLIEHPQGTNRRKDSPLWMPGSIETFERLLLEGRLRIAVNPALRSAVDGATFWMSPAGLRRFEKAKANRRIDMAVAAAMGVGAATQALEVEPESYLVRRDIVLI